MDDDDRPRRPANGADAAARLAAEPLDRYSQDELGERIRLLEAEIVRVERHRLQAAATRTAADRLFGGSGER